MNEDDRRDTTDTANTAPPPERGSGEAETGPNPLAETVPNSPSDVSANPLPAAPDAGGDHELAVLEQRLRDALSRAERGTEILEEAVRRRRQRP